MALTFLPSDPSSPANLGYSFGTGLGQGLQALAFNKLNESLRNRQKKESLMGLKALGFGDQEADSIAGLDPAIQREIIKQKLQAPAQQAYAQALSGLLGGQQLGQAPQMGTEQEMLETFGSPLPSTPSQAPVGPTQGLSFLGAGLNQQQATELAKLALKKEESTKSEIAERYKATQPYRKEILDAAKAARSDLKDLNRMEELEREGKLDTAGYSEFLKRSGLDIPSLMNPGSEEFTKLANNFVRNAKHIFGSRISNYEIEQFLKTIPSLSQSPEGRKRVVANLKQVSRAALEYNNALKEVLAENGGIPPYDLQEKVDDKIEKKLDKLGELFKKEVAREVPAGQNRLITALQSAAGSVLGAPGQILSKLGSLGSLGSVVV